MRKMFDESEMQIIGEYKPMMGFFGKMQPAYPKYNRPVTPKGNFEMIKRGEVPYWIPNLLADANLIHPLVMPDASARAYGGVDWFGIEWQMEDLTGAPMVKPGTRRLSDITNWKEELPIPDVDSIDWEKDYKENYEKYMYDDRPSIFLIVNGYFERIADLTSFEDAFCYLLEEPEALDEFYTALDDFHMGLIRVAKEVYHCDMIVMHDDMGSQRSPFFSPSLFREIMMPHYKKITSYAHELGMLYALHSCGCVGTHIPLFIVSGFDAWEGQRNCNDMKCLIGDYGRMFQIGNERLPGGTDEEVNAYIHNLIDTMGFSGRYMLRLGDTPERYVKSHEEMYRYSRKLMDDLAAQQEKATA